MQRQQAQADPFTLLLAALAAYRCTRLVTADTLTEPARQRLFNRYPPDVERAAQRWTGQRLVERAKNAERPDASLLGQLVDCPWCASVYITAAVLVVVHHWRPVPLLPLTSLALSTIVGFLGAVDRALA